MFMLKPKDVVSHLPVEDVVDQGYLLERLYIIHNVAFVYYRHPALGAFGLFTFYKYCTSPSYYFQYRVVKKTGKKKKKKKKKNETEMYVVHDAPRVFEHTEGDSQSQWVLLEIPRALHIQIGLGSF